MDTVLDKGTYDKEEVAKKTGKPMMWIALVSIIMFFAGLTSAVVVRMGDGNWANFELPQAFLYSSIVIILSSVSLYFALVFAKEGKPELVKIPAIITLLLGVVFVFTQFAGYFELVDRGIYFTGAGHNDSASYLYLITAVHLVHLLGGLIALSVVVFHALKNNYNPKNLLGLQLCSTYWHFLGVLWIYLYVFFSFVI